MLSEDLQRSFGKHVSKGSKEEKAFSANTLPPFGMLQWSWGAHLNSEAPKRGMTHDNKWTNTGSALLSNLFLHAVSLSEDYVLFFCLRVSPGAKMQYERQNKVFMECFFIFVVQFWLYSSCTQKFVSNISSMFT